MMSFVKSMDTATPKQYGENKHVEYTWSNSFKEKLVQFFFQLVRTKDTSDLEKQLNTMLSYYSQPTNNYKNAMNNLDLICNLYKLIGQTRDIISGKGEYNLTYMQIYIWYKHFPELALFAIDRLVYYNNIHNDANTKHANSKQNTHPYGSWKDMKYLCQYVKEKSNDKNHEIIDYVCKLYINQLKLDFENYTDRKHISLASKWCPREKSKFSWMFSKLSKMWCKEYFLTVKTENQKQLARRKASREFRKLLSIMNKYIDTTQIKMANKSWSDINFNNVTSQTMSKNKLAFFNKKKNGEIRYENDEDRIQCSDNLENHIQEVINNNNTKKIHGKRVSIYDFVKSALNCKINNEKDLINIQWKDNRKQNNALGNFIPMADTSGSMTCDNYIPLYHSIGLSIRISELANEAFRNRILTFSERPEWINLDRIHNDDFVRKVKIVNQCNWGFNTNFYKAMKMILDSMIENNVDPQTVQDLVLVVFSDMQIDNATSRMEDNDTMYKKIEKMYANAGMKTSFHVPYKPPHILFWNLRNTNGFPVLSTQKNVTMLSGYSPVLINTFCDKGIEGLKEYTPYKMLCDLLKNERYEIMENELLKDLYFNIY